jgi:acyl carrier protein
MGLDSVEIVMSWEEVFGIRIPDAAACNLITPRQAIDYICASLPAEKDTEVCLSMKIFYRIRKALHEVTGLCVKEIRPHSMLSDLFPRGDRNAKWHTFRRKANIIGTRNPWTLSSLLGGPKTVEDLVFDALRNMIAAMKPVHSWTRSEVREVVREAVREQIGVKRFSDHDEFVKDLGID